MKIFDSAIRIAAPTSATFLNTHFSGLMFILNITLDAPPVTVGFKIQINIPGIGFTDFLTFATTRASVGKEILVARADGQIAEGSIDEVLLADLPLCEWQVVALHTVNPSGAVTYSLDAFGYK